MKFKEILKLLSEDVTAKAPYEMTQDEYHQWRSNNGNKDRDHNDQVHRRYVENALDGVIGKFNPATGKREATVPENVLKAYPDLKKK